MTGAGTACPRLLGFEHLCQFMAQLRAVLVAMHSDSVLYRRFQKFLFRIG